VLSVRPVLGASPILGVDPVVFWIIVALIVLIAVWGLPRWQGTRWAEVGKDAADLENHARTIVVQIVGGLALLATFAVTLAQVTDSRETSEETLRLTAAQQTNERFSRATDQLASQRVEIRVGGIYSLERVAAEDPHTRPAIGQILLSYLQQHHRVREPVGLDPIDPTTQLFDPTPPCNGAPADTDDDLYASLTVVLALADAVRPRYRLSNLDLRFLPGASADFSKANLSGSYLSDGYLPAAKFDGARLTGTDFSGACLEGATFIGIETSAFRTSFKGADLRKATLSNSTFESTAFQLADLRGATVQGNFRGARFDAGNLRGVSMRNVVLREANLTGADIRGTGLTLQGLREQKVAMDECTRADWRTTVSPSCPRAGE
jgi:uncharacterized protein YjbI with pentapeptide repeats